MWGPGRGGTGRGAVMMMKTTDELVREAIVEEDARRATRKKHKLLLQEENEKNDHAPGQLDPRSHNNKAKGKQAQVRFRDEHRDSLDDGDDGIALER